MNAAHMLESESTISGTNMNFCVLNLHGRAAVIYSFEDMTSVNSFCFTFFILRLLLMVTKGTVNKARTNSAWVSQWHSDYVVKK